MTNTQFFLTIGIPYLTLGVAYVADTLSLHAGIKRNGMRASTRLYQARLSADNREVYLSNNSRGTNDLRSNLSARMDRIEKRLDTLDAETRIKHDHRLAVLEAKLLAR